MNLSNVRLKQTFHILAIALAAFFTLYNAVGTQYGIPFGVISVNALSMNEDLPFVRNGGGFCNVALSSLFMLNCPRNEARRRKGITKIIAEKSQLEIFAFVQSDQETNESEEYFIRDARYGDLKSAAQILVKAFYEPSQILKYYHELKELNRLQLNFPYSDPNHYMFVAISKNKQEVIGFVDVDTRMALQQRNAPPRPYLSDLAVHENYRRKGIASALISKCEEKAMEWKKDTLYLRVEQSNTAALRMYFSLGYDFQPSKIFGVLDTTMLLKRDLRKPRPYLEKKDTQQKRTVINPTNETKTLPLDYVV